MSFPKIGQIGFEIKWIHMCLAGLAAVGLGCTHVAGKKNDTPIICNSFELIRPSVKDTEATIKQIDVYNKTWECFCVTRECQKGGKYYSDK